MRCFSIIDSEPPAEADAPPMPPPPNSAATGSPGARCEIVKMTTVIPNSVGTMSSSRLRM
jgi:hypothetical protein